MKALICSEYGPPDKLAVQDVPPPQAGPGQVVVDVKAAALNFPDALMVQGLYQVKPPLPFSPGAEVAGLIKEVGEGVQGLKAGDRVIGFPGTGGFAEECTVAAEKIMPLPENMDFASGAALVLTYGTSLHALQDCGRLQPGETLLVLGAAGGVGAAAVEIGKALGARVIAAASSGDKLALCRQLGADETIDYTTEDLRKRALALTGEKGVDVVYDPVGGGYTESALRAMAWRGRLLIVGFAAGEIPKIPLNLTLLKGCDIVGVFWGSFATREPQRNRAHAARILDLVAAGTLRPHVDRVLPFARAAEALERLEQRQVLGKVVLVP